MKPLVRRDASYQEIVQGNRYLRAYAGKSAQFDRGAH
jgi:hypothetical protein